MDVPGRASRASETVPPNRAHNCYYEPCTFYARKSNVTAFYFCTFFEEDLAEIRAVSVEGRAKRNHMAAGPL